MDNIYMSFPEKLLEGSHDAGEHLPEIDNEVNMAQSINMELLRICRLQKRLLDEQSSMIIEMLESMGR